MTSFMEFMRAAASYRRITDKTECLASLPGVPRSHASLPIRRSQEILAVYLREARGTTHKVERAMQNNNKSC